MTPLNNWQKQLLFDYCLGLTSEKETAEAEALISSNAEAAEIDSKLKATVTPLESVKFEPCPNDLAERTIRRLSNLANSGLPQLQQLLASEQTQNIGTKSQFWWNLGKIAAAAAVILIVLGTWFAPLDFVRAKYRQQRCQMQLSSIFQGLNNYISDHDGQAPAVATATGAPWWKVGYKGKENHSNTRHIWLLVKDEYVNIVDFVCSGSKDGNTLQLTPSQINTYKDFPDRRYVTYSYRIRCGMGEDERLLCRKAVMADLSPLFEKLPDYYSESLRLSLDKKLLTINSINHKRRGQNVLFGDGRVEFLKTRHSSISRDDVFTLQNTDIYQGWEVPSYASDAFLAP